MSVQQVGNLYVDFIDFPTVLYQKIVCLWRAGQIDNGIGFGMSTLNCFAGSDGG